MFDVDFEVEVVVVVVVFFCFLFFMLFFLFCSSCTTSTGFTPLHQTPSSTLQRAGPEPEATNRCISSRICHEAIYTDTPWICSKCLEENLKHISQIYRVCSWSFELPW